MGLGYPLISGNTHVSLYLRKDTINDRRDCPQEIKWSDWTEKINSEKLKSRKSDTACPTDNWQSVCFRICPRLGLSDNGPPQDLIVQHDQMLHVWDIYMYITPHMPNCRPI